MPLFTTAERAFLGVLSRMVHCNPFLAERFEFERLALGRQYVDVPPPTGKLGKFDELRQPNPNHERLDKRVEKVADACRNRLTHGESAEDSEEARLYEDLILYMLYRRYRFRLDESIEEYKRLPKDCPTIEYWPQFAADIKHYLGFCGQGFSTGEDPAHVLALFIQVRRAMHNIFDCILGTSQPIMELRGAVWRSIFTRDMRSYRHGVYTRMSDFTTLITGASGTGKELVARAIGLSRYVPVNGKLERLAACVADAFYPLDLSALPETLVESALFGHKKGAFTGASETVGWLQQCPPTGAVFLDEIGHLKENTQVKLLRVLEGRRFYRLGELREREFQGKIIAATNRDLPAEIRAGRFRADFYYRLRSDLITTPSLRTQFNDRPEDLYKLAYFAAHEIDPERAESLAEQVVDLVNREYGADYPWPGNVRELKQCVRSIAIHEKLAPVTISGDPVANGSDANSVRELGNSRLPTELTAKEVLRWYCTLVYWVTGGYEAAGRWLGIDPRTVKKNIDRKWLDRGGDVTARNGDAR